MEEIPDSIIVKKNTYLVHDKHEVRVHFKERSLFFAISKGKAQVLGTQDWLHCAREGQTKDGQDSIYLAMQQRIIIEFKIKIHE